jgi:hypothetical protein
MTEETYTTLLQRRRVLSVSQLGGSGGERSKTGDGEVLLVGTSSDDLVLSLCSSHPNSAWDSSIAVIGESEREKGGGERKVGEVGKK